MIQRTLQEQMTSKCIYFNGVMNECCKAGIKYRDVRAGPMMLPCLKSGGECSKAEFPTEEKARQELDEMLKDSAKVLEVMVLIKDYIKKRGKVLSGSVECSCGGEIQFRVAEANGHIRAMCSTCHLSFME